MKKLFIILAVLILVPITVNAAGNDFTTSFDSTTCELVVSGTQTGHEAQVAIYKDGNFQGLTTDTIVSGNFGVRFTLTYDQDTKIKIRVADENGNNEIVKDNITVPACSITPTKLDELFDNQGNSIIIKDKTIGFEQTDKFDVEIQSKSDIDQILESMKGTPNYDNFKNMFDKMLESIGEGNDFKYYILPSVRDDHNNTKDYSNYNDGFTLNLLYSKDEYKKFKNLKLISIDDTNFKKLKDLTYTYDETNQMFVISIDRPGIILVYDDNTLPNTNTNPNTGDKINRYIILLTISTLGLIGVGIYTKKKIFN